MAATAAAPDRGTLRGRRRPMRPFTRYLLRRLMAGVIVIVVVTVTVFAVTRIASDPVRGLLPFDATQQQYDAIERQLGLDQSIPAQFVDYVGDLASFDLGDSYWQKTAVRGLVFDRLPNTLLLVAVAVGFAMLVGIPLGIGAALRPSSSPSSSACYPRPGWMGRRA
jgi:peptide/nickel transport system permease protein